MDTWEVVRIVHEESIDCGDAKSKDATIHQGVGGWVKLVAVGRYHVDQDDYIADLTGSEPACEEHVPVHIVVAVEEADAWAANKGHQGEEQQKGVKGRGNKAAQFVVISTCLGLFSHRVSGEHHSIKLVQRSTTHEMTDVWEVSDVALELTSGARLITEDCYK